MRVLIACEESQAVCKEFRKLGADAYSCDIQPCSGGHPEWHFQEDIAKLLEERWDMIIAFPPCTHLSAAGAPSWKQKQKDGRQQAAIDFVMSIYNNDCPYVCIENPVGKLNTAWRKPDQIINPYQFGDPFKKKTCLWMKGLPALIPTDEVEPQYHYTSNSTRSGPRKDGTRVKSKLPIYKAWNTSKDRSKTFPGIAKAIATQWYPLINQEQD